MRNAALFSILIAAISFQRLQAQEWVRQHPFEVLEPIKDVAMAPNGHGIAVGNKSTVRYTTDYGAHWLVSENIPPYQTLDKVAIFPDGQGNTAIATNNSKLYKTTDGGVNWQTLPDPPSIGGYRYFSTPAADAIYIAGNSGVLKSLDKGDSWTVVSPAGATGINWTSISFVDTAKGWLGGQNGQVYRTTDGGANWTQVADGQLDNRVTLDFLNATTGYAGVHRKLFKTTDGGQNWTLMLPTAFGSHISDLEIIDQNRFVASQGNRTFYSADGGVSVTLVRPTPYSYENFGVSALPDGQVWVASTYTAIAHSTDSGASYTDQIPGNKNALGVIRFTDQQNGWACGYGKTVLRTTDGEPIGPTSALTTLTWITIYTTPTLSPRTNSGSAAGALSCAPPTAVIPGKTCTITMPCSPASPLRPTGSTPPTGTGTSIAASTRGLPGRSPLRLPCRPTWKRYSSWTT